MSSKLTVKLFSKPFLVIFILLQFSCSIYRSPERNDFEAEHNQIKIENLNKLHCSDVSTKTKAATAHLVQVDTESPQSPLLLWELSFKSSHQTVIQYESDNTQGEYCVYEK